LFKPDRFEKVVDQLRCAATLTPALFTYVIAEACIRLPALSAALIADRIARRVEAGAWTDAALAIIELELPAWKLRHLSFEDCEWSCSLSNQIHLPASLDDTADGRHAVLPLAILSALVEAQRRIICACEYGFQHHHLKPSISFAVCCENFA
jgi:hypothetical protein